MADVEFWFELASTYSYIAASRMDACARERNLFVRWRPFLLGPIFANQGWATSPFKIYPAKGEYMWRDMERLCARADIPFKRPPSMEGFPQHSVLAARVALVGLASDWGKAFVKAAYHAQFYQHKDIAEPTILSEILRSLGQPDDILEQAVSPPVKAELRANTENASKRGVFGAPSFTVGSELFWGNDRLEHALEWACQKTPANRF